MKNTLWKPLFLAAIVAASSLSSCDKNKEVTPAEPDYAVESVEDNTSSESSFEDTDVLADAAILLKSLEMGGRVAETQADSVLSCVKEIRHDKIAKIIMIDFGTQNCKGFDGKMRRGKIRVSYEGRPNTANFTRTTTFVDFFVNDNQIQGTRKVTITASPANATITQSVMVREGKISFTDGTSATWQAERVRIISLNTPGPQDDVVSVTGSTSGVNRKGGAYSSKTTSPLIRKMACLYSSGIGMFLQGTIEITPANNKVRLVDFGKGDCDRKYTVTVDGKTKEFEGR